MVQILNAINVVFLSVLLTYHVVYFLLWFFKYDSHKKMFLYRETGFSITMNLVLFCSGVTTAAQYFVMWDRGVDSVIPLGAITTGFILIMSFFLHIEEIVTYLRSKIPDRS